MTAFWFLVCTRGCLCGSLGVTGRRRWPSHCLAVRYRWVGAGETYSSISNALELRLSCGDPSISSTTNCQYAHQTSENMKPNFVGIGSTMSNPFLAATKQLYEWYFLSVCLSVCLSVRHTFLTMFPSSYHHEIFRSYHHGPG